MCLMWMQVQNLIGFGVGAMFFVAAGWILYIKASLARCLPPPLPEGEFSSSQGSGAPFHKVRP